MVFGISKSNEFAYKFKGYYHDDEKNIIKSLNDSGEILDKDFRKNVAKSKAQ